ncbi:hypothetical protein JDO7802_02176 [Jannaschia donghaensis]|uniref:Uncharacterized protein n=1 Tax=Jannaschia donghaensis TaxID=420998 RepID=A0A0M6YIH6_9RHOB|nr:hypothetical protein JDO7802_02176 [Jannaschia donghaensis]
MREMRSARDDDLPALIDDVARAGRFARHVVV